MASKVGLQWDEVRSILSLYHLDELEDFGGLGDRDGCVSFWVRASGRRYVLKLSTRRRFADMVFEKDLLRRLSQDGLRVPDVVVNVASGSFTPWETKGRYVTLFSSSAGRALGRFEITGRHIRSVGEFIGRLHSAVQGMKVRRANEWSLAALERALLRLDASLRRKRLPKRFAEPLDLLRRELDRQATREFSGPVGIIHGRPFVESCRFERFRLTCVSDFETACSERFAWDVAAAINAWCWVPSVEQRGGPSGHFDAARVRTLLRGYVSRCPEGADDRTSLVQDARLVATRFAIERLMSHEMKKGGGRTYRDYRHFTARLEALAEVDASVWSDA